MSKSFDWRANFPWLVPAQPKPSKLPASALDKMVDHITRGARHTLSHYPTAKFNIHQDDVSHFILPHKATLDEVAKAFLDRMEHSASHYHTTCLVAREMDSIQINICIRSQ